MKKITKYIASDGKEFDSEEEALIHEEVIYVWQDFEYLLGVELSFREARSFLDELVANTENFLNFFLRTYERRGTVIELEERLKARLEEVEESEEMPF